MKRKKPIKTFVIKKTLRDGIGATVLSLIILSVCAAGLKNIIKENKDFTYFIIDNYLSRNKVYAQVSEVFLDPSKRVNVIMGNFTKLVAKEDEEKIKNTEIKTPDPREVKEENKKVITTTTTAVNEVKNLSGKSIDFEKLASEPLSYTIQKGKPQVLIVHTHTTESYYEQDRSVDENKNMLKIGSVIKDTLEKGGIGCIHDKTVHDYPSYSGAYTRSANTTKSQLANNKDIKIVFDVHRDAVATADGSKLRLLAKIGDKSVAQVMFVVGTDAQLPHDNWQENLKLALKLQKKANEMYPDLMRPINLRQERFNQQLSKGSIIIEIGTNANSYDEAINGAKLIAEVISSVLSEQIK